MSDKTLIKLTILWERELRLAARMLKQASDIIEAEHKDGAAGPMSADATRALFDAFDAANAALAGADDEETALILSSQSIGPPA